MNFYDGMRYRVESTQSSWADTDWVRLPEAMRRLREKQAGSYLVVDQNGVVVAGNRLGLLIDAQQFTQRTRAK